MIEFGSDFHRCDLDFHGRCEYFSMLGRTRNYECGRHAIDALVLQEKWKRIWIPAYFCYEVIGHIASTGIKIKLYEDCPLREDDEQLVRSIPYRKDDVLLRMNFFGIRSTRTNDGISVPVIEDHTHDIYSAWSLNSDADFCVASIRKSLPVAAGGILWSPKGRYLPEQVPSTLACESMAAMRYEAMELKTQYLKDGGKKEAFRRKYVQSEEMIDNLPLSGMDQESNKIAHNLDIKRWTDIRNDNWQTACELLSDKFVVIKPEKGKGGQLFSIIVLCKTSEERMTLRQYSMSHGIYPAILWQMPDDTPYTEELDFSKRMLSFHCDARYGQDDIIQMCRIINGYYD